MYCVNNFDKILIMNGQDRNASYTRMGDTAETPAAAVPEGNNDYNNYEDYSCDEDDLWAAGMHTVGYTCHAFDQGLQSATEKQTQDTNSIIAQQWQTNVFMLVNKK